MISQWTQSNGINYGFFIGTIVSRSCFLCVLVCSRIALVASTEMPVLLQYSGLLLAVHVSLSIQKIECGFLPYHIHIV